jgi:hypothetical protein
MEIILLFFGLGFLFKNAYLKQMIFLIIWILIAPIPSSLIGDPHSLRSSFILPPLIILSALGLYYLWNLRKILFIKVLFFVVVAGIIMQFIFIIENLYFISPNKYSRFWSYPARLAVEIALENQDKYDYIFLSDRIDNIEFAFPIYTGLGPEKILEVKRSSVLIGEYEFKKYGNIYMGPIPDSAAQRFLDSLNGSKIYIGLAKDRVYLTGGFDTILGKDKNDALVVKMIEK